MAKGYWIATYRTINDPGKFKAYADMAGPVLTSKGGKFLARGMPAKVYEQAVNQRVVLIEFESVEQAVAAHDSPEYQKALFVLGDGVERELRIVEGVAS